jgi:hypothetical protein
MAAAHASPSAERDAHFWGLARETRELYVSAEVPRLSGAPDPLTFLRDYVAANRPVIIENAIAHWPALRRWTHAYLASTLGDCRVSVNVTPNGHGDAVVECGSSMGTKCADGSRSESPPPPSLFVMPERRRMPFSQFIANLSSASIANSASRNSGTVNNDGDTDGDEFGVRAAALEAFGAPTHSQVSVARTRACKAATLVPHTCQSSAVAFTGSSNSASDECEACRLVPASDPSESPACHSHDANDELLSTAKVSCDDLFNKHSSADTAINGVCYLSEQNSSFRTEFAPLRADVDAELAWATAAFGAAAEAVNLWMGDGRAVSAMHKDHYENMCVSRHTIWGNLCQLWFLLTPPCSPSKTFCNLTVC